MSTLTDTFFAIGILKNSENNKRIIVRFGNKKFHYPRVIKEEVFKLTVLFAFSPYAINLMLPLEEKPHCSVYTLPLLSLIVGKVLTDEILIEDRCYSVGLGIHIYKVDVYLRYSYYDRIGKRLAINGSKTIVYGISSQTDLELPDFTFIPNYKCEDVPLPEEILISAKNILKLCEQK